MSEYRTLTLEDITPEVSLLIEDVVESWFATDPLNREDFADRLEAVLPNGLCLPCQFDDPIMMLVLKMARKVKRELN
jgi:hypothetical protein